MNNSIKTVLMNFQKALSNVSADAQIVVEDTISPDANIHMCNPLNTVAGSQFWTTAYMPLIYAIPDLERRDMIVLSGTTPEGQDWIGCMGNYLGTMLRPWLDIPPTGHLVHMRYHEFFRVEAGVITEAQIIWDIPELMMQAHAWPLAPQLGKFIATPAPMTQDGLTVSGDGQSTMDLVVNMLTDLCKHPVNPDPAVMNLEKYWHPRSNWYGPAGIGTARGIAGFRNWHQIPFLKAMPDRKLDSMGNLASHWFAEGNYVCETGWPNMRLSVSAGEWMGIAPSGKEILMRSLDFWRVEGGRIRENWVLIDLLDVYDQLGVNALQRMREFNKARNLGSITLPESQFP
jgi:predicted ester cyclase